MNHIQSSCQSFYSFFHLQHRPTTIVKSKSESQHYESYPIIMRIRFFNFPPPTSSDHEKYFSTVLSPSANIGCPNIFSYASGLLSK
mmetsp:Transcript_3141/g.6351  ORF Transcript_3141/g.6351 Transcript_3141/m.6351 type:complete len:86 (-) Transcript_3141:31-288(-)